MDRGVRDNPELLSLLMNDAAKAPGVWCPKARWLGYAQRITNEIERVGLKDFRTNYRLLKGFSEGGTPLPTLPRNLVKRVLWRTVESMPVMRAILAEERRLVSAMHRTQVNAKIVLAQLILAELERDGQMFVPPDGLAHGGAEDAFTSNGCVMTALWVDHLARAFDIYRLISAKKVETIAEVGSGLVQTTLAHQSLNPHLKWAVNIDIPPVLYIAGQYLRSIPTVEVVDYSATRDLKRIHPQAASDGRMRVYMLAPWQTPRLEAEVDLFLNAASFQEMDRETCAAYAKEITRLVRKWAILHCGRGGEKGEIDPNAVSADFVLDAFRESFATHEIHSGAWQMWYQRSEYVTHIFAREGVRKM